MNPGDVAINRGGMHKWRNVSDTHAARMIYVILSVKRVVAAGKELEEDLGYLAKEYPSA